MGTVLRVGYAHPYTGDFVVFEAISAVVYARIYAAGQSSVVVASGNLNTAGDTVIALPAGTFRNLRLTINGMKAAVDFSPYLRINADAGANYNWSAMGVNHTAASGTAGSGGSAATGIGIGYNTALLSTALASYTAAVEVVLSNPQGSAEYKNVIVSGAGLSQSGPQQLTWCGGGLWSNNAAITSLSILLRNAAGASIGGAAVNATAGTYAVRAEL